MTATLFEAASHGNAAEVRRALEQGAEAGGRPLRKAAQNGHHEAAGLLLEAGADPDAADADGWTPLLWAANGGHRAAVWLLLERGADPDKALRGGWDALKLSTMGGHAGVAEMLRSYGAGREVAGAVPLVRDCRAAVEEAVRGAGDGGRDVARLCGDYVSTVDRW